MAAVGDGDQAAFDVLYDRSAGLAFGVAARILRDRALAEEVTQEAFIDVWKHACRFDAERGSARGWVVMLTKRRAVDRVRTEQSRVDRSSTVHTGPIAPLAEPHDIVVDADERTRVAAAIGRLSAVQRQSLELSFYTDLTHVQIADHLGIPLGTVKTRINGGYRELRLSMSDIS